MSTPVSAFASIDNHTPLGEGDAAAKKARRRGLSVIVSEFCPHRFWKHMWSVSLDSLDIGPYRRQQVTMQPILPRSPPTSRWPVSITSSARNGSLAISSQPPISAA